MLIIYKSFFKSSVCKPKDFGYLDKRLPSELTAQKLFA